MVDQVMGGDELDMLVTISSELALFELKDKEFNLGNAYSFGAKMGWVRPEHPVIITSESVGNDVKEHFRRSGESTRRSGRYRTVSRYSYLDLDDENQFQGVRYIEGLDLVRDSLRKLVSVIYHQDAGQLIERLRSLAVLSTSTILGAVESHSDSTIDEPDNDSVLEGVSVS